MSYQKFKTTSWCSGGRYYSDEKAIEGDIKSKATNFA